MSIMRRISRVFLLASAVAALGLGQARAEQALPNILWITSEDNGPHLGCYGDTYAVTPNLDRFAKRSSALYQGQFNRAGLRPSPHNDHLRHLPTGHRLGAYAQHDPPAGQLQNVPRLPPRTRLLLHKQFQGGLQPGKGRRGLE